MYKYLSLVITSLIFSVLVTPVYANDLSVSCNQEICELSSKDPIFPSNINWIPEEKTEKTITITNTDNTKKNIFIRVTSEDAEKELNQYMNIQLLDSSHNIIWDGTLDSFINDHTIFLSQIEGHNQIEISMIAQMDDETPNNLQQKSSSKFNLSFGFEGSSNTNQQGSNTSSGNSNSNSDNGSGSNSNPSSILGETTSNIVNGITSFANRIGINQPTQNTEEVLSATDSAGIRSTTKAGNPTRTNSTEICTNNWYWLLILVAEISSVILIIKKIKSQKKYLYFTGVILLSTGIIFLMTCTKWYALLALLPLVIHLKSLKE